jgi:acyl-CoA dehydrogenase
MHDASSTDRPFVGIARTLGPGFAARAAQYDVEGRFVADNYAELKQAKVFSAGVPQELGGGGASHAELCEMLRELAHHCGSTALALSMHTHLLAAAVWRYRHGQPAEAVLRKIAASELVLISTGAGDWVNSTGRTERAPGGFRVSAAKRFGSGCPAGDLILTSAPYDDPERGPEVLHFAVPLQTAGVSVRGDWDTLGMRGTGSHTIDFEGVFVPDEAVVLRRPRNQWHSVWSVTLGVATPLYMAPYVGIAERAAEMARETAAKRPVEPILLQTLGEIENALATAHLAWHDMVRLTNNYDFEPTVDRANRMLIRKTIVTKAAIAAVNKAVELVGGGAYFRNATLERLLRDVQAAPFHPLPEKRQLDFTGRVTLGLEPI